MLHAKLASSVAVIGLLSVVPAAAATPFFFSTGAPDGKIATASRPDTDTQFEIESADDFVLTHGTSITSATFTGLLPFGTTAADVSQVIVEMYRVFPKDSDVGRTNGAPLFSTPNVPTRVNSPSDVAFQARDAGSGLTFSMSVLNDDFSALNSVTLGGIHPLPGIFTGGNGAVRGEEVQFTVTLANPFLLPADQYFFVPQVQLDDGDFLWLSAPRPIVAPGTPFPPGFTDLQSWTRDDSEDDGIEPDWLRIGTDITHQGPFNAAFSLNGALVPEPSTWAMMLLGFAGLGFAGYRHARKAGPASA
jgi:PEP-CTERM motif